jgi:hypothetical protein
MSSRWRRKRENEQAGGAEAEFSRAAWRKSSYSNAGGDCVEVAPLSGGRIGVRDTKERNGPVLVFTSDEWHAFLKGAKGSQFDLI